MFNQINDWLNNQLHKWRFWNWRRIDFHDLDLSQAISKKTKFKDELIELIESLMWDDKQNRYEYDIYRLSERSKKNLNRFDWIRITKNWEAIKWFIDLRWKYSWFREEDTKLFSAHFYTNNSLFINISPLYTLEVDKTDYSIKRILNDDILEEIDFVNLRHFTVLWRNSKWDYIYEYRMNNEETNKIKLQKTTWELFELSLDSFVNYSGLSLPIHWRNNVRIFETNNNFVFIIQYEEWNWKNKTKVVSLNVNNWTTNELNLTDIIEEIAENEDLSLANFDLRWLKLNKWNQIHIFEHQTIYSRVWSSTEPSKTELYLSRVNVNVNWSLSFSRRIKKVWVFNKFCSFNNIRTEYWDHLFVRVNTDKNSLIELNWKKSYWQNVLWLLSYDNWESFNIFSHQNIFVSELNNERFESLWWNIWRTFLTTFIRDHFLTVGSNNLKLFWINLMEKNIVWNIDKFMNIDYKLFHFNWKLYDTSLWEYELNKIKNWEFNNALYYSTVWDWTIEVLFDWDIVVLSEEEINELWNWEDLIVWKKVYVHNEFNLRTWLVERQYLSYKDWWQYIGKIINYNELLIEIENNFENLKLIKKV